MARLDVAKLSTGAVLVLTACSSSGARPTSTSTSASTGSGGHGGAPGTGGSTASSTVSSTSIVTVGAGGGGGGLGGSGGAGGAAGACDPPAAAGSLWALSGQNYPDFIPVSMCKFRGDAVLIVNTAAI